MGRTNEDYLAENGWLGRRLSDQEIEDEARELALEEQGFFDDLERWANGWKP